MNDNLRNSVPVATSETTAFEGLLDVYRFPDGRIAVSSRGAVRGLTGGGADDGKIMRYASGMIAESGGAKLPLFHFITPRGTRAKGLLIDDYVKIVEWYANRFLSKTLHASQLHIGMQCMAMQAAAARLGWEALSKSWFGEAIPVPQIPILYAQYVRDHAEAWSKFYQWELPEALAPLIPGQYGKPLSHLQWPRWMATVHSFLYNAMLGSEVVEIARAKRDELGAETIHQALSESVRSSVKSYLPTFVGMARASKSYRQWQSLVLNVLGVKAPTQLDLLPDDEDLFISSEEDDEDSK